MISFMEMTLSENDKRLLFVLLIIFVILFILLGLIGVLIRKTTTHFSKRMEYEMHEAITRRVIQTPEQLKKYGMAKNRRLFSKEAIPPFCIAIASLLMYLIYSFATGIWAEDYFGNFSTLLFVWDWNDPSIHHQFFGLDLLCAFPPLVHGPEFHIEYWGAYILVPLWLTSIGYYLVVIQAYVARWSMVKKRMHSVFEKSLENFNYFEDGTSEKKDTNNGAQK